MCSLCVARLNEAASLAASFGREATFEDTADAETASTVPHRD